MLGLKFQCRSHVQRVERSNSDPRCVPARQFRAHFECLIGQGGLPPKILGVMLMESLQNTFSFTARDHLAENVLFDGMCALGHVKRRHP